MARNFDAFTKKLESLAEPSRLMIFILIVREANHCDLMESPPLSGNCTMRLAKLTGLSQATVSHHISKLSEAELLISKRKGKFIFYFPNPEKLKHFTNFINSILEQNQDAKYNRLEISRGNKYSKKVYDQLVEFLQLHEVPTAGPTQTVDGEVVHHLKFTYHYLIRIIYTTDKSIVFTIPDEIALEDKQPLEDILKKSLQFLKAKPVLES